MQLEKFIDKWLGTEGGAERANYQMFLTEMCVALGLPSPDPSGKGLGDYEFEAPVKSEAALGKKGTGRIDLYKRGCFILEAKQSQLKEGETAPPEPAEEPLEEEKDLFGNVVGHIDRKGKRPPRYDRLMADARIQAERYSLALPGGNHQSPPFLIVADIGRAFELYFDWTGDGRGYGFFPDQQNYRITLEDLHNEDAQALLKAIWTDPTSVDPRQKAIKVTRDIAKRLSRVAEQLEKGERERNPGKQDATLALGIEATSLFLMRILFCMFAEDVKLLPEKSFTNFLEEAKDKSALWWRTGLTDLWKRMNNRGEEADRFWSYGDAVVRYFNGNLFSSAKVYDLPDEFKGELYVAAKQDWRAVEPAIFGTLLEQVLTKTERSKLGAHYTPRPYVQRLVNATIADVLKPEWAAVRDTARQLEEQGKTKQAITTIAQWHKKLSDITILDPACGTGNFLYVAMELLLQLENEAIQLTAELGGRLPTSVHPNQFLGLELNPRAAVIAELVLWIGWLRHRLANHPDAIGDPVLPTLTNINGGGHGGFDAVLVRTGTGEPDIENPRQPAWPKADFIVGNPPFIGGKDIRRHLGDDYTEALWKANPNVPKSADFVMQWWDRAAAILTAKKSRLSRFGFVTTNSITQTFSRRVIERYLLEDESSPVIASPTKGRAKKSRAVKDKDSGSPRHSAPRDDEKAGMSIIYAIADHPWTKATKDAAAVRIAMTVAEKGKTDGRLIDITSESGLETDRPKLEEAMHEGAINPSLTIGAKISQVKPLWANEGIATPGVKLHGSGFIVTPQEAKALGLGMRKGLDKHIRHYRNGRDLLQRSRNVMVIDLLGLDEKEVRQRFPEVYQHLLVTVKPGRDANRRKSYRDYWWIHGEPRKDMRPALTELKRYIATVETAKHRIFEFVDKAILSDNKIICLGVEDADKLGALNSKIHLAWSYINSGLIGMANFDAGHVYVKSKCFDPFPFPDASDEQRTIIGDLAEELDALRKDRLGAIHDLTMTEIYNLREQYRAGTDDLPAATQDRIKDAQIGIIDKLHGDIDDAVADAYGWGEEWRADKLGSSEIVTRLVALNAERAAEEASGKVRWLRPDYQIPRFAHKIDK